MTLLRSFLTYIKQKQLFLPSDRLLLAVSGGVDSMVLAELCHRAGFQFGLAHCNFQLRGESSELDQELVREKATQWQVDFFSTRFETASVAEQKGISIQMAARELRYAWFEEIRQQHGYDYILTGHHRDDQLETVLLNLTRGTGLVGLHGILPKNGHLVRPLLNQSRDELLAFALEEKIEWREDESNQSTDYQRNKIRIEVIPALKQLNPQVSVAVAELTERVASIELLLREKLHHEEVAFVQRFAKGCQILIAPLESLSAPVERLAYVLKQYQFSFLQCQQIWESRHAQAGKQFFSPSYQLTKDRATWLVKLQSNESAIEIQFSDNQQVVSCLAGTLRWEKLPNYPDLFFENDLSVALVDTDAVTFPLTLRPWREGDWFCPLGMKGKRKKISNLLVDLKVPLSAKPQVYVLESAGKIVWVVGFRLDERFKVNAKTEHLLRLEWAINEAPA